MTSDICTVVRNHGTCGNRAIDTMTTACMHGHTETFRVCEVCYVNAWLGQFTCQPCEDNDGVNALTLPQVQHTLEAGPSHS